MIQLLEKYCYGDSESVQKSSRSPLRIRNFPNDQNSPELTELFSKSALFLKIKTVLNNQAFANEIEF